MNTELILKKLKKFKPCKSGFEKAVNNSSMERLCELFFENSDWALEQNFPSKEILQKYSGYYEQYGIFYRINSLPKGVKLAIFDCESELNFSNYDVSEIIIRGNSKIAIKASGFSKIFVTILDDSELTIEETEDASVNVFQYGGTVKGGGSVKQKKWE